MHLLRSHGFYKAPPTRRARVSTSRTWVSASPPTASMAMIADRGDGGTDGDLGHDASGVRPMLQWRRGTSKAGAGGAPGAVAELGLSEPAAALARAALVPPRRDGHRRRCDLGAAGSATGAPPPASSANGCTCRASAVASRRCAHGGPALGCLAIAWQRYRRRRTSFSRSSSRTTPAS